MVKANDDKEIHDLIAGCLANDRRCQEAFYHRYFPAMIRLVRRYTDDEDEQISIVNNGFLKVFQKLHTYAFKGSLEGWVRRIVFNALSDYYRGKKGPTHFLELANWDMPSSPQILTQLYAEDLMALTGKLSENLQEVFILYAVEGYSHAEIGKRLNIPIGTSKWRLSEARRKIRRLMLKQKNRARNVG